MHCAAFIPLKMKMERGGGTMNMYEALSLMIAFGILVATIMSK